MNLDSLQRLALVDSLLTSLVLAILWLVAKVGAHFVSKRKAIKDQFLADKQDALDHQKELELARLIGVADESARSERQRLSDSIDAITKRLEKEFGGNSGGAREKMNTLAKDSERNHAEAMAKIEAVDVKVDGFVGQLQNLSGQFQELTRQR
jgi:hypothetical protein